MSTNQKIGKYHISRKASQLAPSGIRKFFDLLANMEGVISLGVGEPDYTTPWHIREAAIRSLENGMTMYTSNSGMPELRGELSRYLKNEYQVNYDANGEILITVGVSEALDLVMRAILDPDDEVIVPDPSFVAYSACVFMAGGVPVMVPTYEKEGFELSPEAVAERITPKTRAILIGYPANPTGAVMPREKLLAIAELAKKHHLTVISDEIYGQLIYGIEHTCFPGLPEMRDNTVLLGGFSKAFAMTGWRIGYACGPAEIIAAMTKIHQYTMMCASTMGQIAAIEALKAGENSCMEMVADYNRRRRVIVRGLREIGLPCFEPKGAFYAFPSIKHTGLTSEDFAEKLLTEEKVAVVPGSAFGECGEGYIRCCYATSMADIEEALVRMKRFLQKYGVK